MSKNNNLKMKYLLVIIVSVSVYMLTPHASQDFEVGAYYLKIYNPNTPFEKTTVDTIRVLDKKNTYYKYVQKSENEKGKFRFYSSFKSKPVLFLPHKYKKLPKSYSFKY